MRVRNRVRTFFDRVSNMARVVLPLTDLKCRQAKVDPGKKTKRLPDGQGLYLDVSATGAKRWRLRYVQLNGKENIITFGDYPTLSLAAARAKRDEARALLAEGKDPVMERTLTRQAAIQALEETFEALANEWLAVKRPNWSEGYYNRIHNALKSNVYPFIGNLPIRRITGLVVLNVVQKVEKRGALEMASRVLESIGQVFRYAVGTGRADADVTHGLSDFLQERPPVKHRANVGAEGLPEMLRRIEEYSGRPETIYALKLMMHTFPRTQELRWAQWPEIDFEERLWTIPAERMKGRKMAKQHGVAHLVPLSTQMVEMLQELRGLTGRFPFLFPGIRNPKTQPISAETMNKALKILGYEGEQTGHGFRGLASTILNDCGKFRARAIDAQLAHKLKDQVEAAYNHAEYLAERREILQWWSDYLTAMKKRP